MTRAAGAAGVTGAAGVAVVTGSRGFIGSHLVRALLERGFEVRRLVRDSGAAAPSGPASYVVDYHDRESLAASAAFDGATHVFHLAGVTRGAGADAFHRGNVVPTTNLLAAVAERDGAIRRFLHVSSQAAAGPASSVESPCVESHPPAPIEAYGRSKAEAEAAVLRHAASVPATIVRPSAVYGPRDRDFLALFRLLRLGLSVHPGNRDSWLSMIFVDDLVDGIIDAALSDAAAGGTFFLSGTEPVRWRELHERMAVVAGRRPLRVDVPLPLLAAGGRLGDIWGRVTGRAPLLTSRKVALARPPCWVCSPALASRTFGFEAPTGLDEGLRVTHRWYVEAGWMGGGGAPARIRQSAP